MRKLEHIIPILLFSIIWGAVEFLLPVRFSDAGISIEKISILFFISSFVSIVMDIPSGKLSDRIGRERLIVYSMSLSAIALASLYFFDSFAIFLAASILIGVAYGLNWSPILAFVGDHSDGSNHGRAFGDFFTLTALGEALAPILIAILIIYSSSSFPFLILALISMICLFTFKHLIKDRRVKVFGGKILDGSLSHLNSLKLIKKALIPSIFLMATGFFVAVFWQSVWFTQPLIGFYEKTLLDSALIVAVFSLPMVLCSRFMGRMIDKAGEKKVFFFSAFGTIISFFLFYLSQTLIFKLVFIFTASLGVLGIWLVMDVITVKLFPKNERGEFFGIIETVRDTAYAITPLFIGFTYKILGLNGIFAVNSIIAILLVFLGVYSFGKIRLSANI